MLLVIAVDFLLPNEYFDLITWILFCPKQEYLKIQQNTILARRQKNCANTTKKNIFNKTKTYLTKIKHIYKHILLIYYILRYH